MPRVYVVQDQKKRGPSGELVPKFPSISKAAKFGEMQFLLDSRANPFQTQRAVDALERGLRRFNQGDFLLLVGNPCFIGWAAIFAQRRLEEATGGKAPLKMLQWSNREQEYCVVEGLPSGR